MYRNKIGGYKEWTHTTVYSEWKLNFSFDCCHPDFLMLMDNSVPAALAL